MPIQIVPWQMGWVDDFKALKTVLMPLAPSGAYLHHIGSTAVPGLAAKNVIDLQMTVARLEDVDVAAIENAGFKVRLGLVDHCPPGLDLPESERHKIFFRSLTRPANLHVRERGRFNQRFSLLCRDYLRAHPVSAGAYALIKQRLSAQVIDDEDAYYDIKDPVFDIMMDGAEDWARLIGWSEPPAD